MTIMERHRCQLPAFGHIGDVLCCPVCQTWWLVTNRRKWQRINRKKLEALLLEQLQHDLDEFDHGVPMPNWKHSQ